MTAQARQMLVCNVVVVPLLMEGTEFFSKKCTSA